MKQLFLSARGRISRAQFWLGTALLAILDGIIFGGGSGFASASDQPSLAIVIPMLLVMLVVLVFTVYATICIGIKRFHDRDKSGAWILIQFVPMIGPIWYLIEAGCLRGSGPNTYGPDPLAPEAPAVAAY